MFRLSANKIFLAASALLLCAGFAQAQTSPGSPLTASPASVSISFALPNTPGGQQAVVLTVPTANVSDPFVVDPTTVPFWLSILNAGGTATDLSDTAVPSPGLTLNFVASGAASSLGVGAYTAVIHLKVNGYQDLTVPVTLTVTSSASAALSVTNSGTAVSNGGTVPITWVYGSALPTINLTLLSSNYPISFTAVSAVARGVPGRLDPTQQRQWHCVQLRNWAHHHFRAGCSHERESIRGPLTGTVTISYASTTYVINIALTVGEPNPTVSNIFPQEVATQGSGALTVVVTGTGFGTRCAGIHHGNTGEDRLWRRSGNRPHDDHRGRGRAHRHSDAGEPHHHDPYDSMAGRILGEHSQYGADDHHQH